MSQQGLVYCVAKRLLDIVVASLTLILMWPVMLMIYGFIRWHSPGPAIFRQIRIKKNRRTSGDCRAKARSTTVPDRDYRGVERRIWNNYGEPFVFYKFASMYPDARQRFPELYTYDYSTTELKTLVFKLKEDPRVPPWARWLRRSSLDELPNFINVLKGDISLIGPRPDIPEMVKYYTEEQHRIKLSVKPGMTGFAQIYGRGNLLFQETLAYDLEYVRRASFLLDIKILVLTVVRLFEGRNGGAY